MESLELREFKFQGIVARDEISLRWIRPSRLRSFGRYKNLCDNTYFCRRKSLLTSEDSILSVTRSLRKRKEKNKKK